jgi:hypothetical protein
VAAADRREERGERDDRKGEERKRNQAVSEYAYIMNIGGLCQ